MALMGIMELINKIKRVWMRLRLQPIRVLCFHEIGEFCAGSSDWVPTDYLQRTLLKFQEEGYTFIPLISAYKKICHDKFRKHKYAVLTADDGLACQMDIFPWLKEHDIPITLFLNITSVEQSKCGLPYKAWFKLTPAQDAQFAKEIYFDEQTLKSFDAQHISIGSHGYAHNEPITDMSLDAFIQDVDKCVGKFSNFPSYVPFYAYLYGAHNNETDKVLHDRNLVPMYMDGLLNYNDPTKIHRESLEKMYRDETN